MEVCDAGSEKSASGVGELIGKSSRLRTHMFGAVPADTSRVKVYIKHDTLSLGSRSSGYQFL